MTAGDDVLDFRLVVSDVDAGGVMHFLNSRPSSCQLSIASIVSIASISRFEVVYKILHRQDSKNAQTEAYCCK